MCVLNRSEDVAGTPGRISLESVLSFESSSGLGWVFGVENSLYFRFLEARFVSGIREMADDGTCGCGFAIGVDELGRAVGCTLLSGCGLTSRAAERVAGVRSNFV